tara:strand:+ start:2012 stop:2461 length:450 start_codon:yes stop_codon:yes gene_type:complete
VGVNKAKDCIDIRDSFDSRVIGFHSDNWSSNNESYLEMKLHPQHNIRFVPLDICETDLDSWWIENEDVEVNMVLLGIDGGEKNREVLNGMKKLLTKIEYVIATVKVSSSEYQLLNKLLSENRFEGIEVESYDSRYNICLFRKTKRIQID